MVQTELFYPIEAATLERLYPQQDEWWEFWYLLSDAMVAQVEAAAVTLEGRIRL